MDADGKKNGLGIAPEPTGVQVLLSVMLATYAPLD
jgi:hypothetical protein